MKYIKLFEESRNKMYYEVDREEWMILDFEQISEITEFTESEINKLTLYNNENLNLYKISNGNIWGCNGGYQVLISKCKDEWFIARVLEFSSQNAKYFKCDQFDGLESFLKNYFNK